MKVEFQRKVSFTSFHLSLVNDNRIMVTLLTIRGVDKPILHPILDDPAKASRIIGSYFFFVDQFFLRLKFIF